MVAAISDRVLKAKIGTIDVGSTLYNSEDAIKVLQCGLAPEPGMKYAWTHNYNDTLPADVTAFGTTLL